MPSRRPLLRSSRRTAAISNSATASGGPPADTDPPGMTWAVSADGASIRGTMDEAGDQTSTPAIGAFTLTATHATIASCAWVNATTFDITMTSGSRITDFETPLLSYTAGANPLRDAAGNNLPNFTNTAPNNASTFLQGAVLILNAYRAASYTLSGSNVTAMVNEATGTSHSTTGNPQYAATGLNGRPSFDFDGLDDRVGGTDSAIRSALVEQAAHHLFCVAQTDNDDLGQAFLSAGIPNSTNSRRNMGLSATGAGRHRDTSNNDAGTATTLEGTDGAPDTSPHVYEYFGDTTSTMRRDGGAADINGAAWNPGTTANHTVWAAGAQPTTAGSQYGQYLDGDVAFLVLFNSVLTTGINSPANVRSYLYFLSGLTGS